MKQSLIKNDFLDDKKLSPPPEVFCCLIKHVLMPDVNTDYLLIYINIQINHGICSLLTLLYTPFEFVVFLLQPVLSFAYLISTNPSFNLVCLC